MSDNTLDVSMLRGQLKFFTSKKRKAKYRGGLGSGKTWILVLLAITKALQGHDVLYLLPSFRMITDVALPKLREHIQDLGLADTVEIKLSPPTLVVKGARNGSILFRSGNNPDSLRGINAHHLFIDEAGFITSKTFKIALARARVMLEDGHTNWIRCVGTPTGLGHWFSDWDAYTVSQSTMANPYVNEDVKREMIAQYGGLDSLWARQELLGEVVDLSGSNILIPVGTIVKAFNRKQEYNDDDGIFFGIDVGGEHGDPTGFVVRKGSTVLEAFDFRGDPDEIVEKARMILIKYAIDMVIIDSVGVGYMLPGIMRKAFPGVNIQEYMGSWAGEVYHNNCRTLTWDRMRAWLDACGVINEHAGLTERKWKDEMCQATFSIKGDKMCLEQKADMKKRGVNSPNVADALSFTFLDVCLEWRPRVKFKRSSGPGTFQG